MPRSYLKFPELVEAKKADLLKLKEDKIDNLLLEIQKSNHQQKLSFNEYQNEAVSSKSVYGYVTKSAKQLFSLLNSNSKVKKTKSPDDNKLNAILENQKILASLIVKIGRNQNQLNEIFSNDE